MYRGNSVVASSRCWNDKRSSSEHSNAGMDDVPNLRKSFRVELNGIVVIVHLGTVQEILDHHDRTCCTRNREIVIEIMEKVREGFSTPQVQFSNLNNSCAPTLRMTIKCMPWTGYVAI